MNVEISPSLARILLELLAHVPVQSAALDAFRVQLRACASTEKVRGTGRARVICIEQRPHIRDATCGAACGGVP